MRKRLVTIFTSVLLILCLTQPAVAWKADFFEPNASGSATFEEMAISPQAIYDRDADKTFITFQGAALDPYVATYNHADDSWDGPYRYGQNFLSADPHGAPALVIDKNGYLLSFYGGHLGSLRVARSVRPHDISEWVDLGQVRVWDADRSRWVNLSGSYPQPSVDDATGRIRLYYRRDDNSMGSRGDWESIIATGSPSAPTFSEPETILKGVVPGQGSAAYYWYANIEHPRGGRPAIAAVRRDYEESVDDFHVRKGVYYLERSEDETWTNAAGAELDASPTFEALAEQAAVLAETPGEYTNQVVLRRDAAGRPCVLYLKGTHEPNSAYEWRFARWNGMTWRDEKITTTDHFFDAGVFEVLEDGTIEAFLTTGGVPDDQWLDDPSTSLDESRAARRGGDITQWRSTNGGVTWSKVRDIIKSPGAHARYGNPQLVRDYDLDNPEARLLFSEYNNDASSFIHKVYLWGDSGFRQRQITPRIKRLAGTNRIETAVEISKQTFPEGTKTAVIATQNDFPDALCGVPLAQAFSAPVLLSHSTQLDPQLGAELKRLDVDRVILLGGNGAISAEIESALKQLRNSSGAALKVERIKGADRYATSVAIADRLAARRNETPDGVVIASGENFPDALSVSPYAARRGYPILLSPSAKPNDIVLDRLREYAPSSLLIVGGTNAVSNDAADAYEVAAAVVPWRLGGGNRYETASLVAQYSIGGGGHTLERFALATGEAFADAMGGGLLAARVNGVLLLTRPAPASNLHEATRSTIELNAFPPRRDGVIDAYILGGPMAVSAESADSLAALLGELDAGRP